MALLVPNGSEQSMLSMILNKSSSEDLSLKLYSNNKTPSESDTESDYTAVSGGGYAAKALTGSSWTISTVSGTTTATYAQQSFDFTGSVGSVYGYFVTQSSGALLWAERFSDGPYAIANNGDQIKVTPKLTLD